LGCNSSRVGYNAEIQENATFMAVLFKEVVMRREIISGPGNKLIYR
jgi:hypothetical protein